MNEYDRKLFTWYCEQLYSEVEKLRKEKGELFKWDDIKKLFVQFQQLDITKK